MTCFFSTLITLYLYIFSPSSSSPRPYRIYYLNVCQFWNAFAYTSSESSRETYEDFMLHNFMRSQHEYSVNRSDPLEVLSHNSEKS